MTRDKYLDNTDVKSFVDWACQFLPQIQIALNFNPSRYVPGGINCVCSGLESVLAKYKWASSWTIRPGGTVNSCDWESTRHSLTCLGGRLKAAITGKDESATFNACEAIVKWGGDRNPAKGATRVLKKLKEKSGLVDYLEKAQKKFVLSSAHLKSLPDLETMNAMLTKVHALASSDGLPIYDARVAAAIAGIIEVYRNRKGLCDSKVPETLDFPPTGGSSSPKTKPVTYLCPSAKCPTSMAGKAAWASAKIRLGWLLREILDQSKTRGKPIFEPKSLNGESNMHAFEATLFMIGYDISCLKRNISCDGLCATASPEQSEQKSVKKTTAAASGRPSKKALAAKIYSQNKGRSRKDVIALFVAQAGLTTKGASTYYQNFRNGIWEA